MCSSYQYTPFHWATFLMYLISYALAIAALSLDQLTKYQYSSTGKVFYCGWEESHESDQSVTDQSNCEGNSKCGYKDECSRCDGSTITYCTNVCDEKTAGEVYLAIAIIGLFLGLITIFGFFKSAKHFVITSLILFSICCFISVGVWKSEDKCSEIYCDSGFVDICSSTNWGNSLILLLAAGGMGLLTAMSGGYTYW